LEIIRQGELEFWDLVFKRYSSPFIFLDNLILANQFHNGIITMYKQIDEEKLWQLYLSNPIKEKSFVDWRAEIIAQNTEVEEENIEAARNKAKDMLKNFKPY